jgi:uncharacterized oxidoreductase
MQMNGNTILITGGASGIGLALAEKLQAGNTVIIAGRRQDALDAAVAAHPGLIARRLDPASVLALAEWVAGAHPGLNVLVNNAGIMRAEDLAAATVQTADAEATVVTNLLGPIRLTAALLPQLRRQARATVINVTSGLAFLPLAMTPTYSATKAALHSYTQSLRHQLRDTGIEVLELAPPMVQTELMPGQSVNPMGMPLDAFITEALSLLGQTPAPDEVLVERVKFLRHAEANGSYAATFAMLNGGH